MDSASLAAINIASLLGVSDQICIRAINDMDKKMLGISKSDTDIPKLSGKSKHTEALAIAPETVQLVWNYSKMSVTEVPDHWMDVVSLRN